MKKKLYFLKRLISGDEKLTLYNNVIGKISSGQMNLAKSHREEACDQKKECIVYGENPKELFLMHCCRQMRQNIWKDTVPTQQL